MAHTTRIIAALVAAIIAALPAAAAEDNGYRLLRLDGERVRWGEGGHAAHITYAVAQISSSVHGIENCRLTTGVGRLLKRSQITQAAFDAALRQAFQQWSQAADVQFEPARPGTAADITVTAEAAPDGIAFTDVTHHGGSISRAIICLNPKVYWTPSNAPGAAAAYRLRYVLAHEIGHAIGLDHPGPDGTLMSFEYNATRDVLAPGDAAAAALVYGPASRVVSTR